MRDIRRPESLEPIVERLTNPRHSEVGVAVFATIMDLLIFCAGVGFATGRRSSVPSSGKAVPYRVFENNQKEGYIYLVSLAEAKSPEVLAASNDDETVRCFEEYAAGGLQEVASWLAENPMDVSGVQSLLSRLQSQLPEVQSPEGGGPNPV